MNIFAKPFQKELERSDANRAVSGHILPIIGKRDEGSAGVFQRLQHHAVSPHAPTIGPTVLALLATERAVGAGVGLAT